MDFNLGGVPTIVNLSSSSIFQQLFVVLSTGLIVEKRTRLNAGMPKQKVLLETGQRLKCVGGWDKLWPDTCYGRVALTDRVWGETVPIPGV